MSNEIEKYLQNETKNSIIKSLLNRKFVNSNSLILALLWTVFSTLTVYRFASSDLNVNLTRWGFPLHLIVSNSSNSAFEGYEIFYPINFLVNLFFYYLIFILLEKIHKSIQIRLKQYLMWIIINVLNFWYFVYGIFDVWGYYARTGRMPYSLTERQELIVFSMWLFIASTIIGCFVVYGLLKVRYVSSVNNVYFLICLQLFLNGCFFLVFYL